jgi:MFS family permease
MIENQEEKISKYHILLFIICFLGTAFAGTISTLMSVYLPVAVRDLLGNRNEAELNRISAYINAVFIFGGSLGGFLSGWISDKAGRKIAVILSVASYGVFTLATGFMPVWWGVVICRFFSGFGLGGVLVTTTTMMVEEWPEKTRAIFIGFLSVSIPVGIFSAGVIDYFVSSWRNAFLIGIIPISIAIIAIRLLKESKKWQQSGRSVPLHQINDTSLFSVQYRSRLIIGSLIFGTMLIGMWAIFSWIPTWIQTIIINSSGQNERGISMMVLGIGGLTGGLISGWFINTIGLRRSMLLCFSVCIVFSFLLFKTNPVFSLSVYLEIAVMALFFGISQGVLSVYIPYLFPVKVRGTATGFCFNIGRIFTATAVLFVGVLVSILGGYSNALFIFSFVFLIGLVVTFFSKDIVNGLTEQAETTIEFTQPSIPQS